MRLRRPLTLALACLAAALLIAACGGSSSKPDPEVSRLLADTFGPNKPVSSGRLNIRLGVSAKGLPALSQPLDLRFDGPFQSQGAGKMPKFDFDLALSRGTGDTLRAGAVSTGDEGFLKLIGNAYRLDPKAFASLRKSGTAAADSATKRSSGLSLSKLGVDPRRWLIDAKKDGTENVGGTESVHITAGVKVAPMLADLDTLLRKAGGTAAAAGQNVPQGIDQATRDKIGKSVENADLDIWTGEKDHALRRIRVDVAFDVPEDQRTDKSTPQKGTVVLDLTIAGLNQPQAIGPPANPRPISELTAAVQQAAAQLQGQTSGGSGSGSAGGSATTPGAGSGSGSASGSKYDQCVAAAGADLAKAQQCAPLLGQ